MRNQERLSEEVFLSRDLPRGQDFCNSGGRDALSQSTE